MPKKLQSLLNNTLLTIFLVSLTACSLRQPSGWRRTASVLTHEERSRIHDLTFPLNVQPTKLLFNERQMVLSFTTELTQAQLIKDYRAGMEYWGWDEVGSVAASESCLIFIKPSKVCAVMIRPEGSERRVMIFSTIKKK